MERKIKSEGVSKISVSKFKDYFLEEGFCSEDFVMSPMVRFKTMTGAPRVIEGMTVGVICNGTAKVVINDRAFELRPNSLFLLREESKIHRSNARRLVRDILLPIRRHSSTQ